MNDAEIYTYEPDGFTIQVVGQNVFLLTIKKYNPGRLFLVRNELFEIIRLHSGQNSVCGLIVDMRHIERSRNVLSSIDCYTIVTTFRKEKKPPSAVGFLVRSGSLNYQIVRELMQSASKNTIPVARFDALDDAVAWLQKTFRIIRELA